MKMFFYVTIFIFCSSLVFGEISFGVGTILRSVKSNLEVTDNKKLNVLGKPDTLESDFIPVLELRFAKDSDGKTFFVGTDFSEGLNGVSAGVKNKSESGKITSALLFNPFKKVWKDPYLKYVNRSETNAYEYGGYFKWEGIKRTDLSVKYFLKYTDVKNDDVVFGDLKRDSFFQSFGVSYNIGTGLKGFALVPELGLAYNSARGKSMSYKGYFGGLSGVYVSNHKRFFAKIQYENEFFNKKDPLFLKTRNDKKISATLGATVKNILNKGLYTTLITEYSAGDTKIDFYYESKLFMAILVGYEF